MLVRGSTPTACSFFCCEMRFEAVACFGNGGQAGRQAGDMSVIPPHMCDALLPASSKAWVYAVLLGLSGCPCLVMSLPARLCNSYVKRLSYVACVVSYQWGMWDGPPHLVKCGNVRGLLFVKPVGQPAQPLSSCCSNAAGLVAGRVKGFAMHGIWRCLLQQLGSRCTSATRLPKVFHPC